MTIAPSLPDHALESIDDAGFRPVDLRRSVSEALARVPPLWPLKHWVAVNPFAAFTEQRFPEACALLRRVTGAAPVQAPAAYEQAWKAGAISREDLKAVCAGTQWTPERLIAALRSSAGAREGRPLDTLADRLDAEMPGARWGAFVVEELSKWCAVRFDENQTMWRTPWRTLGLYEGWKAAAGHDANPEARGISGFRQFVESLPEDADACIAWCVETLAPTGDLTDFLHRQLATIAGWAGHARYLDREVELRGGNSGHLKDLLAMRLAYDTALWCAFIDDLPVRRDVDLGGSIDAFEALALWQDAWELCYRRELGRNLAAQPSAGIRERRTVQAVFCIDVRSEVFRRHLENHAPGIETRGFAGFFGIPVAHKPAGASGAASRCPVLLVPPVASSENLSEAEGEQLRTKQTGAAAWRAFQNSAASTFSFVETVGLAFGVALAKVGRFLRPASPECACPAPSFDGALAGDTEARAKTAENALRGMGLTKNFARLILLCGHGSHTTNNPFGSGLDCGACGGHAGDVNARLAVSLLNDPAVRERLALRGIVIPADTWAVAGLHNTTSDDVELFDLEAAPATHAADIAALKDALRRAGGCARRERAARLDLGDVPAERLDVAVRARMTDASQIRPEWGLATNAAFVAAPRARTAGLDLGGRVFLHEYDPVEDPEGSLLRVILSAPVVVASWINLQYYASTVDPVRYGAGDKTLHQVVGGLGVVEGNGGDLKTGLPLQSVHDGRRFLHEPRRLAVFVEAPRARIDAVLTLEPRVRALFDNGWLTLHALEGGTCHQRHPTLGWQPV